MPWKPCSPLRRHYGLNNLLRVMADDLSVLCQRKKVDAYTYAGPDPKPAATK
jgi:hypothetical protein